MAKKKTPHESADKAEASDGGDDLGSMERFKSLARLLSVSNAKVPEERRKYPPKGCGK